MNKMKTIARIAFATLALYIILQIIKTIVYMLFSIGHSGKLPASSLVITCLGIVSLIAFAIIIIHQLLIKGDKWALRVVSYPKENQPETNPHWLPVTFQLVARLAGILFLYWTIPAFFGLLSSFYMKAIPTYGRYQHMSTAAYFWPRFASFAIKLALTVYFLCGAQHFTHWQVRKTLEYCKESAITEENQ